MIEIAFREKLFPPDTEFGFADIRLSTPELDDLLPYDVAIVWCAGTPDDPQLLGDRLADYVDAGGTMVIGQFCFSTKGETNGRIMTEGYSPFRPGPNSLIIDNRQIDPTTVKRPLHPIFYGTDITDLRYVSQPDVSSPGIDPTSALIAEDTHAELAIGINADGNIIALNWFLGWYFGSTAPFFDSVRVIANSALFVAGRL